MKRIKNFKLSVFLFPVLLSVGSCCDNGGEIPNTEITIHSEEVEQDGFLELEAEYYFTYAITGNNSVAVRSWTLEIFTKTDEMVTVPDYTTSDEKFSVILPNLGAIPKRDDYARAASGFLKAQVLLCGTFADGETFKAVYPVELPCVPEKPVVQVKSVVDNFETWESDVLIEFSSLPEVSLYAFTVEMDMSSLVHPFSIPGNQPVYQFYSLWLDVKYEITAIAVNKYGKSEAAVLKIGGDPEYYGTNPPF